MSKLGGGRSIQDRVVYAQATEPDFERDGVLWVDTSTNSRDLRVYSGESGSWEDVVPDQPENTANVDFSGVFGGLVSVDDVEEFNVEAWGSPSGSSSIERGYYDSISMEFDVLYQEGSIVEINLNGPDGDINVLEENGIDYIIIEEGTNFLEYNIDVPHKTTSVHIQYNGSHGDIDEWDDSKLDWETEFQSMELNQVVVAPHTHKIEY